MADGVVIADLQGTIRQAAQDAEAYFLDLRKSVAAQVAPGGKVDRKKIDEEQRATHGLAWVLTYVETLKETANWADRIAAEGKFGEIEQLLTQILFGEYLYQLGRRPADDAARDRAPERHDARPRRSSEAGHAGDPHADS